MTRTDIEQEYFKWMYSFIADRRYSEQNSFKELLLYLHDTEFIYLIKKDANRAEDGEDLRYKFVYEVYGHDSRDYILDCLARPCSVLEMMIALSIRCEEIMDDPSVGNRVGQWFWKMINNLGLSGMYGSRFNEQFVKESIERFMNRQYEPDGRGGLFRIKNCKYDMRDVEIWVQMLWTLDTIA